jgi:hypothetical protein
VPRLLREPEALPGSDVHIGDKISGAMKFVASGWLGPLPRPSR